MSNLAEENDDRCQDPQGCLRSLFTYCPHCHLFLCMAHLNQHHDLMKNQWNKFLEDIESQRKIIKGRIQTLQTQKIFLNELFQQEITDLTSTLSSLTNLCQIQSNEQEKKPLTNGYDKHVEQLNMIKKCQIPRVDLYIEQFDKILRQFSPQSRCPTSSEKKIRILKQRKYSSMNLETGEEISTTHEVVTIIDDDDDDDDSVIEDSPSIDPSYFENKSQRNSSIRSNESSESNLLVSCPLTHLNAFGIKVEHGVSGIPCQTAKDKTMLSLNQCFHHLLTHHRLKAKAVRMIITHLASIDNHSIDPESIDFFSTWPTENVISQSIALYVRLCPLTIDQIYGLKLGQHYNLCTPRSPVHLEQHFRTVHHFKPQSCKRFIRALIDDEPFSKEIFQLNETIIDQSKRKKSLRKRQMMKTLRNSC